MKRSKQFERFPYKPFLTHNFLQKKRLDSFSLCKTSSHFLIHTEKKANSILFKFISCIYQCWKFVKVSIKEWQFYLIPAQKYKRRKKVKKWKKWIQYHSNSIYENNTSPVTIYLPPTTIPKYKKANKNVSKYLQK